MRVLEKHDNKCLIFWLLKGIKRRFEVSKKLIPIELKEVKRDFQNKQKIILDVENFEIFSV